MTKRVAILQSNYIPWKGYFDIIHDVDECIFLEDVQYTPQNWRNRNRIKTANGPVWLSIPVGASERRLLGDVELPATGLWAKRHWRVLEAAYAPAPYFSMYRDALRAALFESRWRRLSDLNRHLIELIARDLLGITTTFSDSRALHVRENGKQERLLRILHNVGAGVYVSGPRAQSFLDPARFAAEGIELVWKDYTYPEYEQLYPPFRHDVSILDLLFHVGEKAPHYIWGWRTESR